MLVYNYTTEDGAIHHSGIDSLEHGSHKYISKKMVNGKWRYIYEGPKIKTDNFNGGKRIYVDYANGNYRDKAGIIVNQNAKYGKKSKNISVFNTGNDKFYKNGESSKGINKKIGRLSSEYAEDGVEYKLNLDKKKKNSNKKKTPKSHAARVASGKKRAEKVLSKYKKK